MSSNNINYNKEIIALFSGQSQTITIPRPYIQITKTYTRASVLNQCIFWHNKSSSKDGWFYKSYEEWFDELEIPERTLRRIFQEFEQEGWITSKVKKVSNLNLKHIKPNMDKIIDSIHFKLNQNSPNRPQLQNGSTIEQNTCIKVDPTGHIGRSEPANLADSTIYTEENLQKKTTTTTTTVQNLTTPATEPPTSESSSSSFIFSKTLDPLMLKEKMESDTRTDEQFLKSCKFHVVNNSDNKFPIAVRELALLKLLGKLKLLSTPFLTDYDNQKPVNQGQSYPSASNLPPDYPFDTKQAHDIALYEKWAGTPVVNVLFRSEADLIAIKELVQKHKEWEAGRCLPLTNAA
jgi:hypothetical protein